MPKPFCYIPKDKDVPPFVAEFRKMLTRMVGEPCSLYYPSCSVCQVWQPFAVIAAFLEDCTVPSFTDHIDIRSDVKKARKELKAGKTVTLKELKKKRV